jgi:hypothetical protein
MYYLIYKITNIINGKIYIGSHKTKNINDSYMGSGKYLKYAITKYGIENFTKEILYSFDNPQDMYTKESELVDEEFISESNTYNIKKGGFGGFDYINTHIPKQTEWLRKGRLNANKVLRTKYDADWHKTISLKANEKAQEVLKFKRDNDPVFKDKMINNARNANKLSQTPEARLKRKETMKSNSHQRGEKNSNFGNMWITDGTNSKVIKKTELIPSGWIKGRKIKK